MTYQQLAAGGSTPPPLKVSRQGSLPVLFSITLAPTATYWSRLTATKSSWELTQREDIKRSAVLKVGGGEGWGTVQTLVQKGPPPPLPSHHVIIFWPLTVCGCTRKGCTLEHPPLCRLPLAREILLCEQRQKCPKTITFFNIPGIKFRGKMQRSFHFKKSAS